MKDTLIYIAIISITFGLAFALSALLTLPWIQSHWSRQFLVVLLMVLTLLFGALMFWQKAKSENKKMNL